MSGSASISEAQDRRFMAAALRLSGWNEGRTATNPSVGTLIVRDDGGGPVIVGRGRRLFPDGGASAGLRLVSSQTTPGGLTLQAYERTGPATYATYTGVSDLG